MKKYRCLICGEVFDVAEGVEPVCPKCGLKGKKLEEIVEAPKAKSSDEFDLDDFFGDMFGKK